MTVFKSIFQKNKSGHSSTVFSRAKLPAASVASDASVAQMLAETAGADRVVLSTQQAQQGWKLPLAGLSQPKPYTLH
jgi:hypothetical protein